MSDSQARLIRVNQIFSKTYHLEVDYLDFISPAIMHFNCQFDVDGNYIDGYFDLTQNIMVLDSDLVAWPLKQIFDKFDGVIFEGQEFLFIDDDEANKRIERYLELVNRNQIPE